MAKKSDNTNFSTGPRRHAAQGSQPDLLELGQAVRQARVEMGLTQAQLSLVSGTSRDTPSSRWKTAAVASRWATHCRCLKGSA